MRLFSIVREEFHAERQFHLLPETVEFMRSALLTIH
jgi:hypothetical protein